MEGTLSQEKTVASSEFFADQNTPRQEEIPLKSEDDGMRPVMEAVQLKLEMEKRKIREEIIASEIVRQELEAEVRLELMVEKQMMGMRRFPRSYVDHSILMEYGALGSQYRPYFDRKLFTLGPSDDKFVERMKFIAHPISGVDEFMQIDQNPHETNVLASGEKQKIQNVSLGRRPFERDPGLIAAHIAGKSMVESSQEQELFQAKPSSGITGVKRKAEMSARAGGKASASIASKGSEKKWYCSLCGVSATSEGGLNLHLQGKKHKFRETTEQEKSPVASKWHCSLCQVSATSETLLKTHLLGKKHKSKESKLELDQNISNLDDDDSTEKSQEVVGPGNTNVKPEAIKKWYCSLCQVSASSEKNLDDHLQGKKHKAKEISNVDTNLADKVSELVEPMREKGLEGGETRKVENSTPEVGNCQKSESENEDETILEASMDIDGVESVHYLNKEMGMESVKYWHCQMCNEETCDEATMAAHRKSKEHMALLRKHGGGVIVVSRMSKEAVDGAKGAQE